MSVNFLKEWAGERTPDIGVVLGSGLSDVVPDLIDAQTIVYQDIPGFLNTQVRGHAGQLTLGTVKNTGTNPPRHVAFFRGRLHGYEGYEPHVLAHNIRTLGLWGAKGVVLLAASGCLEKEWDLGRFMLLTDHINIHGQSPLIGAHSLEFGERFIDMSCAYDASWRACFLEEAQALNEPLYQGVYVSVRGPQYETPAEIKAYHMLGAQAVGMSVVVETIAARQLGLKVAGLAALTNYATGVGPGERLSHSDVMAMGRQSAQKIRTLLARALPALPLS